MIPLKNGKAEFIQGYHGRSRDHCHGIFLKGRGIGLNSPTRQSGNLQPRSKK